MPHDYLKKNLGKRGRCNEQAIANMLVSRQGAQGGLWPPRAGRTVGDADARLRDRYGRGRTCSQPTPLLQAAHTTITGSPHHYYMPTSATMQRRNGLDEVRPWVPPGRHRRLGVRCRHAPRFLKERHARPCSRRSSVLLPRSSAS